MKLWLSVGVVALVGALAGCGEGYGYNYEEERAAFALERLWRYCAYGAVSRAQLDGCLQHVSPSRVGHGNTNAHEYGEHDLNRCLWDSGPFCGIPTPALP